MYNVNKYTLENGLQLAHICQQAGPLVAVNVLYRVGARYEDPRRTGLAHLMEHVMFGPSENVSDITAEIEQAGGSQNAWTSSDYTTYYTVLPIANIDVALRAEADRMLHPLIDPQVFKVQQSVVIEEFKQQCLNRPYGKVDHKLRQLVYKCHPYSWPVIGKNFNHIARLRRQDLIDWHNKFYAPANAIITVVGDIDFDTVKAKVQHWFGDIPARPVQRPQLPVEAPATAPRTAHVTGMGTQHKLIMAWLIGQHGTPEYYAADVISDLLANGHASRLHQRVLVGSDLFTAVDASITGSDDRGLFIMSGTLTRGDKADIQRARKTLMHQARLLGNEGEVTAYELQRVLNRYEASRTFQQMSNMALAQTLAFAVAHGTDIEHEMQQYRNITPEIVAHTAQQLFSRPACTIVYHPEPQNP